MTPLQIIRAEYGESRNFMTPRRLGVGALPDGAYEYSSGTGINYEPIWGVSVVRLNPDGSTRRDTGASQLFHTPQSARAYIRGLQGKRRSILNA